MTHPAFNASLNAASALFLILGYTLIRQRAITGHTICMLTAASTSFVFLVSYLIYHSSHGVTRFPGAGAVRAAYFFVLTTHTILAVVNVPLIARTLYLAFRGDFTRHVMWARVTLPVWLYVSVTGVVVYWMLYRLDY